MVKKYTVTETWIVNETNPVESTSADQLYERLAKVSGKLPGIDVPLDLQDEEHFRDEARIYDFLAHIGAVEPRDSGQGQVAAQVQKVLDIGTGDGWPALRLAPRLKSVTAIDAAELRVATARANAERLGIANVSIHRMNSTSLDFPDSSFDAVVAASAVEQSPDPYQTLREAWRVLRPGGKLRVVFEAYDRAKSGYTEEVFLTTVENTHPNSLHAGTLGYHYVLRHASPPWERNYLLRFKTTPEMTEEFRRLADLLERLGHSPTQAPEIGVQFLERNRTAIVGSSWYELEHFTSSTMKQTLEEVGFVDVRITYSASTLAGKIWPYVRHAQLDEKQSKAVCQGLAELACM
ncbi:MAG: class I SAM-dependent methyltransferase, partial [candidate division WOR-3 bacterium]